MANKNCFPVRHVTELPATSPVPVLSAPAAGPLMRLLPMRRKSREINFPSDGNGGRRSLQHTVPSPNVEGRTARKEAVMVRGYGIGGIIMAVGERMRSADGLMRDLSPNPVSSEDVSHGGGSISLSSEL